jgi:NAD(P)-dependent dehydrogenase (short-subunit alcohol dehydrogenase family)
MPNTADSATTTMSAAGEADRPGRGSVALVTGANSGIGKQIARQLLAAGLTVYLGARNPQRGRAVMEELEGDARALVLDVTDSASITAAADHIEALDVLVNNAGINLGGEDAPTTDMDILRRTFETNVFGALAVTNAFLPALRCSSHPRIVNISSGTGSLVWSSGPNPQFDYDSGGRGAAYRSSKSALNALTVYYAQALAADGFKVNALAPGLRATNLTSDMAAGGDPAEAAAAAVRLALLPDTGPTAEFISWNNTVVPW